MYTTLFFLSKADLPPACQDVIPVAKASSSIEFSFQVLETILEYYRMPSSFQIRRSTSKCYEQLTISREKEKEEDDAHYGGDHTTRTAGQTKMMTTMMERSRDMLASSS